jgi:hypothetical protein
MKNEIGPGAGDSTHPEWIPELKHKDGLKLLGEP